jgi:hypothetical protein
MKQFENKSSFKRSYKPPSQNKCFAFQSAKRFKPKTFSFILFKRLLISTWEPNSFQKSTLSSKEMVCNWFIKQNPCEKSWLQPFKNLVKSKWVSQIEFQKFCVKKGFPKTKFDCGSFTFLKWEWFQSFSKKIVLFDSNKRAAIPCFKNKLCFQNHLIGNHSKKVCFGLENNDF